MFRGQNAEILWQTKSKQNIIQSIIIFPFPVLFKLRLLLAVFILYKPDVIFSYSQRSFKFNTGTQSFSCNID